MGESVFQKALQIFEVFADESNSVVVEGVFHFDEVGVFQHLKVFMNC